MRSLRPNPLALRLMLTALFVAGGVMIASDFAEARAGRGGSFGNRGARTWSTPAPTPTAPTAQPMQRSAAPQAQAGQSPARAPAAAPSRGMFGGGFMGGMMGGLLGAGLFGLLMGSGFFSGLGSLSGILGLLLQVALIFIVVRLVMGWIRSRNQPSYAGGARPDTMQRNTLDDTPPAAGAQSGGGTVTATRFGFGSAPRGRPITLQGSDFDSFERLLTEVQTAYAAGDRDALSRLMTPEMAGYMGEELDELDRDGLENRLTDVKLLQGDLSEACAENEQEYATVAMRYELKDSLVERATGRLVQGNPDRATQATEFWTFIRQPRGEWSLSAIQQG